MLKRNRKNQVTQIALIYKLFAAMVAILIGLAVVSSPVSDEELIEQAKEEQRERVAHLIATDPSYAQFYSKPN